MKRIIISSVTMGLMLSLVETVSAFSGAGSGTEAAPYIITDVNQLQEIQEGLSAWYELGNDIDASATSDWHDVGGDGFTPIGDNSNRFTGHFDGNDFIISGLYINRSSTSEVGLFGYTGGIGSEIKNVGLEDVSISGGTDTGGLSGHTYDGTISGCYTTGSITGSSINTGGLVGYNKGTIIDSYFTGNVNGSGDYVGGLVGWNCADIDNSYSTGSVSGNRNYSYIGGLVGENRGAISNSCSTASVSGVEYVGGLVGRNYSSNSAINDSYSTGSVSGEDCLGGLVGWNSGTCESCFWDKTVHPNLEGTGGGNSDGITGKTTAEMQTKSTFTDVGWDFYDVWDIKEGQTYPFLKALAFCGDQWHSYPVGDLNYDCHVDLYDFATFTTHWLECTAPECD